MGTRATRSPALVDDSEKAEQSGPFDLRSSPSTAMTEHAWRYRYECSFPFFLSARAERSYRLSSSAAFQRIVFAIEPPCNRNYSLASLGKRAPDKGTTDMRSPRKRYGDSFESIWIRKSNIEGRSAPRERSGTARASG